MPLINLAAGFFAGRGAGLTFGVAFNGAFAVGLTFVLETGLGLEACLGLEAALAFAAAFDLGEILDLFGALPLGNGFCLAACFTLEEGLTAAFFGVGLGPLRPLSGFLAEPAFSDLECLAVAFSLAEDIEDWPLGWDWDLEMPAEVSARPFWGEFWVRRDACLWADAVERGLVLVGIPRKAGVYPRCSAREKATATEKKAV